MQGFVRAMLSEIAMAAEIPMLSETKGDNA